MSVRWSNWAILSRSTSLWISGLIPNFRELNSWCKQTFAGLIFFILNLWLWYFILSHHLQEVSPYLEQRKYSCNITVKKAADNLMSVHWNRRFRGRHVPSLCLESVKKSTPCFLFLTCCLVFQSSLKENKIHITIIHMTHFCKETTPSKRTTWFSSCFW